MTCSVVGHAVKGSTRADREAAKRMCGAKTRRQIGCMCKGPRTTARKARIAAVSYLFPNLSPAELSAALQEATAAERRIVRKD
jgi:hypothetical protein